MKKPMHSGKESGDPLLLDTSTILWTIGTPERLSISARESIASRTLWLSVASYWEIVIKSRKGSLQIADPGIWWIRATELLPVNILPIRTNHVSVVANLPDLHRDPFDRILIGQAIAEGLELVTSDPKIAEYPVRVIW